MTTLVPPEGGDDKPQKEVEGEEPSRDRAEFVLGCGLNPYNLCGSWLHKIVEGEVVLQGLIVGQIAVGQPTPTDAYLVEVRTLGSIENRPYQVLMKAEEFLEAGVEWHFFDNQEWMLNAQKVLARSSEKVNET